MSWDPHREDEARWIQAMRQRHARGQEYVCGLADVMRTLAERDEARAEVERLRRERDEAREHTSTAAFMRVERQRDEARAEVERLRGDLARCREAQRATAEGWRHEVAEIAGIVGAPAHTAELAACVRAEVERLRGERDEARHRARRACQVLIAEVGAHGPADVDSVAERSAAEIQNLRDEIEGLRAEVERLHTERDEARAEVARLTAQLESITAENHARAQREARSLEDWASLRAEVDMLRGVGCREAKAGDPESGPCGPCGACLRCAEERGAKWALTDEHWGMGPDEPERAAKKICRDARGKR
jgi:chromosome segregation ATPase